MALIGEGGKNIENVIETNPFSLDIDNIEYDVDQTFIANAFITTRFADTTNGPVLFDFFTGTAGQIIIVKNIKGTNGLSISMDSGGSTIDGSGVPYTTNVLGKSIIFQVQQAGKVVIIGQYL